MASTASPLLRLELQGTGENLNTWGAKLNASALTLLEQAIASTSAVAVSGPTTLTSTNFVTDEARSAVIKTSGSGGVLTVPTTDKTYTVINNCTDDLEITTGSTSVTLEAGVARRVVIDGGEPEIVSIANQNGEKIINMAAGTAATDGASFGQLSAESAARAAGDIQSLADSKSYTDEQIEGVVAGALTPAEQEGLVLLKTLLTDSIGTEGQVFTVGESGEPEWQTYNTNTLSNRWRFRSK